MQAIDHKIRFGIIRCFGGGSPAVAATTTTPDSSDAEVQAAKEKEKTLARLRKGRASTILTSGMGLDDSGTKKTLLGQ